MKILEPIEWKTTGNYCKPLKPIENLQKLSKTIQNPQNPQKPLNDILLQPARLI